MKVVQSVIFMLHVLPVCVVAGDYSETNDVLQGKTIFYTQTSEGVLSTCGVELEGTDKDMNYFIGTYSFFHDEERGPVPVFRIKSLKLSPDGTQQQRPINSAWIESGGNKAAGKGWVGGSDGDSYLLVSANVSEGAEIYTSLISGEVTTIGFLHKGESRDRTYRLKMFQPGQKRVAARCLLEMISRYMPSM